MWCHPHNRHTLRGLFYARRLITCRPEVVADRPGDLQRTESLLRQLLHRLQLGGCQQLRILLQVPVAEPGGKVSIWSHRLLHRSTGKAESPT